MKLLPRRPPLSEYPASMSRDGRLYDPTRQAFYPRYRPQGIVSIVAGATFGLSISTLAGRAGVLLLLPSLIFGAVVIGWIVSKLWWAAWMRRHPELPAEVWIEAEAAYHGLTPREYVIGEVERLAEETARWN